MKLLALTLFSSLIAFGVFADNKRIAIGGQVQPTGTSYASAYSYTAVDPSVLLGVRYSVSDTFGIDLSAGFGFLSSRKPDLSTETEDSPVRLNLTGEIGFYARTVRNDSLFLDVDAKYRLTYLETGAYVYDSSASIDHKYVDYSAYAHTVIIAIQPGVKILDVLEIFAEVGVKTVFLPNTKYVDKSSSSYNYAKDSFPLKEHRDATIGVNTTGLLLGFRYFL